MKCPACGYNSFGFLDSCKRCSHDFTALKESFGSEPLLGRPDDAWEPAPPRLPTPPPAPEASSSALSAPSPPWVTPASQGDLLFDLSLITAPPAQRELAVAASVGEFRFEPITSEAPAPPGLSWAVEPEIFCAEEDFSKTEEPFPFRLENLINLEDLTADTTPPCVNFDGDALEALFKRAVLEAEEGG